MTSREGKRRAMKITVRRLDGFSFDMLADPDDLVADVKRNIEIKCGQTLYRVENQLLRYDGKVLKDDTTLKNNNVHDNCSIVLIRQVPAKPSRASSATSTTNVVPPANSVASSSTNPDSTPSPLTTVTANSDVSAANALVQASQPSQPVAQASQPAPPAPKVSMPNVVRWNLLPQDMPSHTKLSRAAWPPTRSSAANASVQASQPAPPARKVSGPNVIPLNLFPQDIPSHTKFSRVAWRQTRSSTANASVQASQPQSAVQASQPSQPAAQASLHVHPAPKVSRPSATPLNLFPRGIPGHARVAPVALTSRSATNASVQASQPAQSAAQASQPAQPAAKAISHGGGLDHLGFNPQFRALRALVQANPQLLEPMLEELGAQNPNIRHWIQDHQAEFMQDMLQPPQRPVGNLSNQSADAIPQEMTFTLEERAAIDRLEAMGFNRTTVVQVFFDCNKDESMAANSLLDDHDRT